MLPGFGQVKKQMQDQELDESQFKRVEAIIYSMTPEERRRPEVLERSGGRRRRVADGSGTTVADVNKLLKQFAGARKLMEQISSGRMPKDLAGMMAGADGQPAVRQAQAPRVSHSLSRRHRRR
jgi:signal recognition particle subunit SRP54